MLFEDPFYLSDLFLEVFAAKLTRVVITSLKSPEKKNKTHEHHHLTNIGLKCWPSILWRPALEPVIKA